MDWNELVAEVAAKYGFTHLPNEAIDGVLWEHTSYPMGGKQEIEIQLHEFFSKTSERPCPLCEASVGWHAAGCPALKDHPAGPFPNYGAR